MKQERENIIDPTSHLFLENPKRGNLIGVMEQVITSSHQKLT